MATDASSNDQTEATKEKTDFAKRNPYLEKLVPDAIENAVDAIMPDQLEKVWVCIGVGRLGPGRLSLQVPPFSLLRVTQQ